MQALFDMIGRRCNAGTLEFIMPNGRRWRLGGGEPVVAVQVHDPSVRWRLLRNPRLGLGESYMDGQWDPVSGDLSDLLQVCVGSVDDLGPAGVMAEGWRRLRAYLNELNSRRRAKANASHHYDVDYAVYRRFLDQDLHYSCAYFQNPDDTLEEAQQAKCAHIAAKLDLKPGARVLDIGCGWGSLALYLAEKHGAECTGITLSKEQHKMACARARERGLADRAVFRLQDYRDMNGCFDAIVSVGMFEHVGRPQYDQFFRTVDSLLAADGTALLHTIGRYSPPGGPDPWINKYIFPGGYVPAASEVLAAAEKSGLISSDMEFLRLHYALTLEHWNARFQAARADIAAHMGERFCRMWEFYLQACVASFRHSDLTVFQLQMVKKLDRLPLTRDYLYTEQAARPQVLAKPERRQQSAA